MLYLGKLATSDRWQQGYLKVEQSRVPRGCRPLAGCGARKPGGLPFPTFSPFSRGGEGKKTTF